MPGLDIIVACLLMGRLEVARAIRWLDMGRMKESFRRLAMKYSDESKTIKMLLTNLRCK